MIKNGNICSDMPPVVSASVPTGGLRRGKIIAYILVAIRPLSLEIRRRQWVYWYMGGAARERRATEFLVARATSKESSPFLSLNA